MGDYNTSFLDLFVCLTGAFLTLFLIESLLVNPVTEHNGVDRSAHVMITIEWDKESLDDVDAYLQDPSGQICFFNKRESGLMHLDRDDRGKVNDQTVTQNGDVVTFEENAETISIRGIVPGEYCFNVHMYSKRDKGIDTEIAVRVVKINPKVRTRHSEKVTLSKNGEEQTVFRFTVSEDGSLHDFHKLKKNFTESEGDYGEELPDE